MVTNKLHCASFKNILNCPLYSLLILCIYLLILVSSLAIPTGVVVVIAVQPADSLGFCHGQCTWGYTIQISAQILSQVKTISPFISS